MVKLVQEVLRQAGISGVPLACCGKGAAALYIQLDILGLLDQVQRGAQPDDFKPLAAVGRGVEEIRITDENGAYRVIYVARRAEAVYVLHAFQKKSQATPKKEIDTARRRFAQLSRGEK